MPSDCIEWVKYKNKYGYGVRRFNGRTQLAHRVAYCEANSTSIESILGMVVLHTCDNPACVNPEHLVLGTQADNIADMDRKGRRRMPAGEEHPRAKITAEIAHEILTSTEPARVFCSKYEISAQLVSAIRKRQVWREVEVRRV